MTRRFAKPSYCEMAQSEFASWINSLLAALKELGGSARPQEVVDLVAKRCSVPDAVLDQTITGGTSRFGNQVHWARYYLAEAGLIDRSRRGVWKLAEAAQARGPISEAESSADSRQEWSDPKKRGLASIADAGKCRAERRYG